MTLLDRFRTLAAAAALLFAGGHAALAQEEKSLLATDGTLYVVRAGTPAELGITGNYADPADSVIQWSYLRQDGTRDSGLVPGTETTAWKHNINIVADDVSGAFGVLWTEEAPLLNYLRLGILRAGQWTITDLLPTLGFPRAFNPQMLLSHLLVHSLDTSGNDVWTTESVLSTVWWEDSNTAQARFASIFLDEDLSSNNVQVYDLPAMIGDAGPTTVPADLAPGAYMYPALQLEGPTGGILASFADLHSDLQYVVRITFPTDLGGPGPTSLNLQRRREPIVGAVGIGPIAGGGAVGSRVTMLPLDRRVQVGTYIGANYHPTFVWSDANAVYFTHFDGNLWSKVNLITLSTSMTYDKAIRLVQDMATKN